MADTKKVRESDIEKGGNIFQKISFWHQTILKSVSLAVHRKEAKKQQLKGKKVQSSCKRPFSQKILLKSVQMGLHKKDMKT